jgi:hypothetical protein
MKRTLTTCLGLLACAGKLPAAAPPVTTAAYRAEAAPPAAAAPVPTIVLYDRHGHVVPLRKCMQHSGGGNIDVAQPTPDTVVITMSGVVAARDFPAAQDFDLEQLFEIVVDKPVTRPLKLTAEARVIGLLRSPKKSPVVAEESGACATVGCGSAEVLTVCAPAHSVSGGENLSINDRAGPVAAPVAPGKYVLRQTFHIGVSKPHNLLLSKAASAEFAPDPALDPLWISAREPFHGAIKKDFGFQVTLRIADDPNAAEPVPAPRPANGREQLPPPREQNK